MLVKMCNGFSKSWVNFKWVHRSDIIRCMAALEMLPLQTAFFYIYTGSFFGAAQLAWCFKEAEAAQTCSQHISMKWMKNCECLVFHQEDLISTVKKKGVVCDSNWARWILGRLISNARTTLLHDTITTVHLFQAHTAKMSSHDGQGHNILQVWKGAARRAHEILKATMATGSREKT